MFSVVRWLFFLDSGRSRLVWTYIVRFYGAHSPGLGVWRRNKISNRCDSWACEFCNLKELHNTAEGCFMSKHWKMSGM